MRYLFSCLKFTHGEGEKHEMFHCTTLKSNYDFILLIETNEIYICIYSLTLCYGLNVCAPNPYVESYPQCDGVRSWGSLEIMRSWGWDTHEWDWCPCKWDPRQMVSFFPFMCSLSKVTAHQPESLSAETQYACTLTLDFLAPKTLKNKYLLFNLPHLWC